MRLRTQFSLLLGTLVFLMGVFTNLYFPVQQEAAAMRSLEQKAVTTSAIIASAAAVALDIYTLDSFGDNAELQTVLQIARKDSDVSYLQIFDRDGHELPSQFGALANPVKFSNRKEIQTTTDTLMLHVIMPVRLVDPNLSATSQQAADDGTFVGSIQMGFSLQRMQDQIRQDQTITFTVIVAMVIGAVLMGFLFSNLLMRPLEELEQVVFAFGQGDDNVRAQATGPHEIIRLGAVFNQMLDALKNNRLVEREKAAELAQANEARAEVEKRFRLAFENAPIGMGLLDAEGWLFDPNPALREMLWPASEAPTRCLFSEIMVGDDCERFTQLYEQLKISEVDGLNEKFSCINSAGAALHIVVNLSAVKADSGEFRYSVLQMQDVTEAEKLTNQLEYQASYDELTGLLNRRSFEAELKRAWELGSADKTTSYLLFMDLDQFKIVNDTSGHAAGDQLLRRVSEIILDNVRSNDTVCRLGGDEFGVILWDCPGKAAKEIAEAIRVSIENYRFQWDKEIYHISVSVGGLPIDSNVGGTSDLQQLADAACYTAKDEGRNKVHMIVGKKDSARKLRGQVRWVQRLREAMEHNRFAIYGQVIKPLAEDADEPEHLEILLRLRDPASRKLIPPGAFLPAAERYGLSIELDQWVVRSLLDTLFIHESFKAQHRSYWINLSGTSIGDKNFAKFLKDAIASSPLPPGTINFEITETAVIRSVTQAGNLMSSLREMGCKFALDDFGSGLSSFAYLKKMPVEFLKIDGMFIRDILRDESDRIFVKSIIDIAHTLNIKAVAEFVENDEILDIVRQLGCDYVQGFGIGMPFVLAPQFPQLADSGSEHVNMEEQAG